MGSLFLHVVPKQFTFSSCNGINRCCMDNMWEKKEKVKLSCKKNVIVSNDLFSSLLNETSTLSTITKSEQVTSLLNVGSKEISLNGKIKEEIKEKELVFTDGLGIVRFLKGKVFLISGATGFLAKVLIEKILRTVPDVGKIYLLIKAKDREAAMERLKSEILNTELFKHLKQSHGKSHQTFILSKLIPVVGNICESNLGMEVGIAHHIANEVDIIINSAGNTTFDERYDVSIGTNTLGPCGFLRFTKKCKKLRLFLHVSTAYVNGERQGVISEKPFYLGDSIARERAASENPTRAFPLLDIEAEVKIALDAREAFQDTEVSQKMKDLGCESRARKYGWQDTYVFTKAMGEMMIESTRGDIPVVIIRPSIIEGTYREPIPGWIEGIRMLDPLFLFYAKGELTGFPIDGKGIVDVVPADMVVNAILAATVKHGTMRKPGMSIYHIGSSVSNPILLQEIFGYCFDYFNSYPYMDVKRNPINIERLKLFNSLDDFHSHIWTEALKKNADTPQGMILTRRLKKLLDSVKHLAKIYEPYMFYGGRFDDSNTQKLIEEMSEEERRSFGFDVGNIDWKDYMCNIHLPGFLRHVLKGRGM